MVSAYRVAQFTASTAAAGNTQDVTIAGETRTPVCAIFHVIRALSDDTHQAAHSQGWGATDGTNEFSGCIVSRDNRGTTQTFERHVSSGAVMTLINVIGTVVVMSFSFNSWITGGVRLDIDTQTTVATRFQVFFFFEGDYEVGTHTTSGTVDTQTSQTGMGFDPTFLSLFEWGDQTWSTTINQQAHQSVGFAANNAASGTLQSSVTWHDAHAVGTTTVSAYSASNRGSGWIDNVPTTALVEYGFTSGGFTATTRSVGQAHYVGYVAGDIDGIDVWSGIIEWPTSATTGSYDFDEPNIETVGGMIGIAGPDAVDTFENTAAANPIGMGMWTPESEEVSGFGVSEDGMLTSDTSSYAAPSNIITIDFTTAAPLVGVAAYTQSLGTGGFRVNLTTNTSAQVRQFCCLGFGPNTVTKIISEDVEVHDELIATAGRNALLEETVQVLDQPLVSRGRFRALDTEVVQVVDDLRRIKGLTRLLDTETVQVVETLIQVTTAIPVGGGQRRGLITFPGSEASQLTHPRSIKQRLSQPE